MKILFLVRSNLETDVPIMNYARAAAHLGHAVTYLCAQSSDEAKNSLERYGIHVNDRLFPLTHPLNGRRSFFRKVALWFGFRRKASEYLKKNDFDLIWIGSADTGIPLFGIMGRYRHILTIRELYDTNPFYRTMLRWLAPRASLVVVPEKTRADIFSIWWKLDHRPLVIPNKPFPDDLTGRVGRAEREAFCKKHEIDPARKIILYQGRINPDRDLIALAVACQKLENDVCLVLMGPERDNELKKLSLVCPNLIYLGSINAPGHLRFTALADIGVVQYTRTSLNHLFCAPNKIWEYSKFGIPMLAADLPSLEFPIKLHKAGSICDFEDYASVESCIRNILKNHQEYSDGSFRMYRTTEVDDLVFSAIAKATNC